mgnify:FL=1
MTINIDFTNVKGPLQYNGSLTCEIKQRNCCEYLLERDYDHKQFYAPMDFIDNIISKENHNYE